MREFSRLVARHALAMGLLAATAVALPAHAQTPMPSEPHSGHSAKAHKAHSAPALPDEVSFSITQANDPATGKPYPRMEAPKGLASADELEQEINRRQAAEQSDPTGAWINAAALGSLALGGALGANSLAGVLRRRKAAKASGVGVRAMIAEASKNAADLRVEPTFHQARDSQSAEQPPIAAFAPAGRPSKPRA